MRPPITAGPIERAFKFLKSAALSGGATAKGVALAEGDATGEAAVSGEGEGVCWAATDWNIRKGKAQRTTGRAVMRSLPSPFNVAGQAPHLLRGAASRFKGYNCVNYCALRFANRRATFVRMKTDVPFLKSSVARFLAAH